MSKNSQVFRSSSVQPDEKKENSNHAKPIIFGNRKNISSYSLDQSQQSLYMGINEDRNNFSFHKSAILNYRDYNPCNNNLKNSPQIFINSSEI